MFIDGFFCLSICFCLIVEVSYVFVNYVEIGIFIISGFDVLIDFMFYSDIV